LARSTRGISTLPLQPLVREPWNPSEAFRNDRQRHRASTYTGQRHGGLDRRPRLAAARQLPQLGRSSQLSVFDETGIDASNEHLAVAQESETFRPTARAPVGSRDAERHRGTQTLPIRPRLQSAHGCGQISRLCLPEKEPYVEEDATNVTSVVVRDEPPSI